MKRLDRGKLGNQSWSRVPGPQGAGARLTGQIRKSLKNLDSGLWSVLSKNLSAKGRGASDNCALF